MELRARPGEQEPRPPEVGSRVVQAELDSWGLHSQSSASPCKRRTEPYRSVFFFSLTIKRHFGSVPTGSKASSPLPACLSKRCCLGQTSLATQNLCLLRSFQRSALERRKSRKVVRESQNPRWCRNSSQPVLPRPPASQQASPLALMYTQKRWLAEMQYHY